MPPKILLKIKPPFIALFCILLALLLNYLFPNLRLINSPYNKIGFILVIFGFANLIWSFYLFRKNKTPIMPGKKPAFVVAEGPYKLTRNPMYLSVTVILLGVSFYIGNIAGFAAPLIFFLMVNRIFIPYEEKLMEELFGEKYLSYKEKVRRWM